MKLLLSLTLFLLFSFSISAQSTQTYALTNALQNSAIRVVSKIKKHSNIQNVVVNHFINADGNVSELGIFLSKTYSTELAMQQDAPPIVAGTSGISTKPSQQSGYITVIVSGTITKVGLEYIIDIKLQNAANDQILAADGFVITGKDYDSMYSGNGTTQTEIKKPTATSTDCETNNTCDICFVFEIATMNAEIGIDMVDTEDPGSWSYGKLKSMTIRSGERKCFYKMAASKIYKYQTGSKYSVSNGGIIYQINPQMGEVDTQPCKTQTVKIKL